MSNNNRGGRVVYVGNIPFDFTEFDLQSIVSTVGTVISIKLAFDQMTGKSKGYAFVEYADNSTAASAVRNLNNYPVGNRTLKCGFGPNSSANTGGSMVDGHGKFEDSSVKIGGDGYSNNDDLMRKKRKINNDIPPLPLGVKVPEGNTPLSLISSTLKTFDQARLLDLVRDAKEMSKRDPQLMADLLDQCPQLSSAIIEMILLFQVKTPEQISSLLENAPSNSQRTTIGVQDPVVNNNTSANNNNNNNNNNNGDKRDINNNENDNNNVNDSNNNDKNEKSGNNEVTNNGTNEYNENSNGAGENNSNTNNNDNAAASSTDAAQLEAIKQVIQLTPDQLSSLPEDQRQAVLQIQENYRQGLYGSI
ncbi:Rna15 protein [Saccharomycopsis crataegensis]|uniref:Rna15 protein n=1 Tax=Saccharomycopsis crataegensis TaxID=43959 RepID=A0AAV5QF39_9ASCO|nr:Rna15 protein [Saccharomycopsis crataegensis]